MDQKEPEEHSLEKCKHRTQKCSLTKILLGGPKENEARKALAFQSVMKASGKVDLMVKVCFSDTIFQCHGILSHASVDG